MSTGLATLLANSTLRASIAIASILAVNSNVLCAQNRDETMIARSSGVLAKAPNEPLPPEPLPPPRVPVDIPLPKPASENQFSIPPEYQGKQITLDELVQLTMMNHPEIRQRANEADAARGQAVQAGLYANPQLQVASPQLAGNQSQYNVQITQEIITKGKLRLSSDAAWRAARQAELRLIRARFDVLTLVRQRFYTSLAAQRRVEILRDLVVIARRSRDVSRRLLEGGEGYRSDTILLDIELDRQLVALENAETVLAASKRQLAAGVGLPTLDIPFLAADLEGDLPRYDLLAVQQGVISRNALAQIARVEIGKNGVLLRRAEVEPFPNIFLQSGYQYQGPGALAPVNQSLFQVNLNIPLYNRNQGNVRAAQANIGTANAQFRRVQTELASDAAGSVGRFLVSQQLVDRYEQQILPKARETLRLSQQLYDEGHIDFLRLLQSQRTLIETNLNYVNAQESRWNSAAEVAGLLQSERFP